MCVCQIPQAHLPVVLHVHSLCTVGLRFRKEGLPFEQAGGYSSSWYQAGS